MTSNLLNNNDNERPVAHWIQRQGFFIPGGNGEFGVWSLQEYEVEWWRIAREGVEAEIQARMRAVKTQTRDEDDEVEEMQDAVGVLRLRRSAWGADFSRVQSQGADPSQVMAQGGQFYSFQVQPVRPQLPARAFNAQEEQQLMMQVQQEPPYPLYSPIYPEQDLPEMLGQLYSRTNDHKHSPFKTTNTVTPWGTKLRVIPDLPDKIDNGIGGHMLVWWKMNGIMFNDVVDRIPPYPELVCQWSAFDTADPAQRLQQQEAKRNAYSRVVNALSMRGQRWRNRSHRLYDYRLANAHTEKEYTDKELIKWRGFGKVHPFQLLVNTVFSLEKRDGVWWCVQPWGRDYVASAPAALPPGLALYFENLYKLRAPTLEELEEVEEMYERGYNPYNAPALGPRGVDPAWDLR